MLYCEAIEAGGMAVRDFAASLEMTGARLSAARFPPAADCWLYSQKEGASDTITIYNNIAPAGRHHHLNPLNLLNLRTAGLSVKFYSVGEFFQKQ